jgi:hypothetical protein
LLAFASAPDALVSLAGRSVNKSDGEGPAQATAVQSATNGTHQRRPCVVAFCIGGESTSKAR